MILFRASSVGKLMASPDKNILPAGAITELDKMISQQLLNWCDSFDFFTLEKGKQCENESIELYNEINDTFYVKNLERITKGNLTGECDLLDKKESLVIDIKTAYSKKTYPLFLKISSLYEWQLRSYMHLYDVNNAELAYCLVDTPIDLIAKKDPEEWHYMHDVPMKYRVSKLRISRDLEKEQQLLNRIELCKKYVEENLK
ncbi:hypothetical protein [Acinetobacter phage BUCT629]|uniref:PD-(D/E)XK endonuclease-like domain-containing protein n=2 Tax=Obolenskvirus TaxID=1915205 RepID=A0A1X9SFE6_9CAUD|nr:exonuclease [Acinetobacter phage WCHABP1]ARQ94806.1 hypothetical protein ABP1_00085 [Acinetobacter phage WCHABP1]QZI85309.1 hypothetical protein [Acinetobacter phage BUCT629]